MNIQDFNRMQLIRMQREQIICMVIAAAGECDGHDYKQFAFNVATKVAELVSEAECSACAEMCEHMGIEGYGTLAIGAAIRARNK